MARYDGTAVYDGIATYDSSSSTEVVSLITLGWTYTPSYEENIMADSLNYTVNIQRTDSDNAIRNQADASASISLPDNYVGDTTVPVVNNELDKPVALLNSVMDFFYISADKAVTVKFNSTTGTPFTLRAGGVMVVDGINLTALYLSNTSGSTAVVRIIQALRQDI